MVLIATWFLAAILTSGAAGSATDEPRGTPTAARPPLPHPLEVGSGLELNRALRRARRRDCDTKSIVANIAALGPNTLPAALQLLNERKLPPADGAEPQLLSGLQEKLLLEAICAWDGRAVWTRIDASLAMPKGEVPKLSVRSAAVLASGSCATPDQLRQVADIALIAGENELAPTMECGFQLAADRIYRRRPEGLAGLANSWREFSPALHPALLKAAGATGDPRALELLAQMLDQDGDLKAIALAELARQRAPSEVPSGLFERLRGLLDPDRPMVCQSACTALGTLGDFGSVDALVDLLSAPSQGIRTTAHRALCSMSGLTLPPQVSSWNVWRVRESEWFAGREWKLYSAIVDGTERHAREALQEISVHRWERHRLSDIAAEGLKRPEDSIRSLACSVLGVLGSPRACSPLREALRSEGASCTLEIQEALMKCMSP